MKILLTNNALGRREGSESYLETIAHEFRRLEHEVVFFSPRLGEFATTLRDRGFDVVESPRDLATDFDVIHGQHITAVGLVRERMPSTPLVFACHSTFIPIEDPVAAVDAAAFVAFNDMTLSRLKAHAATVGRPVFRLRQPVHLSFAEGQRSPLSDVPRTAVVVSRRMTSVEDQVAAVFRARGIEFVRVGSPGTEAADARERMLTSEIVIGIGRTVLEAMAMGRATMVLDQATTGGWVTTETYPHLEADGFTGLQSPPASSVDRMLDEYTPALGVAARRLAVRHHSAQRHATRLVEIYQSATGVPTRATHMHSVVVLMEERLHWEQRAMAAELALERHRRSPIRRFLPRHLLGALRRRIRAVSQRRR